MCLRVLTLIRYELECWLTVKNRANGDDDLLEAHLKCSVHDLLTIRLVLARTVVDAIEDLVGQVGSNV